MSIIEVKPIDIGSNKHSVNVYGIQFCLNENFIKPSSFDTDPLRIRFKLDDDNGEDADYIMKDYSLKRLIITPYEMFLNHKDGEYLNKDFQFLKIRNNVKSNVIISIMGLRHLCLRYKKIDSVTLHFKAWYSQLFNSFNMHDGFDLYINNELVYMDGHKLSIGVYNVFKQEQTTN